jgi:hypothetical protein
VVRADDLRAGEQWPAFARACVHEQWPAFARACVQETPVRSMFSVRLVLDGDRAAAMNFYADEPHAFDDLDTSVGAIFAPFAAMALQSSLNRDEAARLHVALGSSRQIGTAIGILMARELITSEEAFARLVEASQHLNRKLRDIAADVVETGALPVMYPGPGKHGSGKHH